MHYLLLFLVFCIVGAGLEWGYGAFWDMVGTAPWTYPDSPLRYTSLANLPLWGVGGLICVSVYRAIADRRTRLLLGAVPPMILAMFWILFYSIVLQ